MMNGIIYYTWYKCIIYIVDYDVNKIYFHIKDDVSIQIIVRNQRDRFRKYMHALFQLHLRLYLYT